MGVVFRPLRADEKDECIDLWLSIWPGESNRAYFEKYLYRDVEWLPYYTQVAKVDGKLVSTAHICRRVVACGEINLTMGGLANVATLPDYRGRGYNTVCLQNAIKVMEGDAMDFSLLFTGINKYYRNFGFVTLPYLHTSVTIRQDIKLDSGPYSVRTAAGDDLPALVAIYEEFNGDRPITVRRSHAYWRDWLSISPESIPSGMLVALNGQSDIVGYIRFGMFNSAAPYGANDEVPRVIECCTRNDDSEAAASLIDAIVDRIPPVGSRTLQFDIPMTAAIRQALSQVADERNISGTPVNSGMVRLLHRLDLLQSLGMYWNERWFAAGMPRGAISFETPYGEAIIDATGPFPQVFGRSHSDRCSRVSLTQSNLFGLVCGSQSPDQVTDNLSLHPMLSALFPAREMVFWGADGF